MKRIHVVVAALAALSITAGAAFAGSNCGSKSASAKQAGLSASSCQSKATVTTASASSCGSATAASMANCTTTAAACAGKNAANCGPCPSTHVVYRVSADGVQKDLTDRTAAMAAAEAGASVQFVALGKTYDSEHDAQMAMTQALYARMDELMTVQYKVGSETMNCGTTATKVAADKHAEVVYTVAARDFQSKDEAEAFVSKVEAVVMSVKMVDSDGNAVEGCAVGYCKTKGDAAKSTTFTVAHQEIDDPYAANLTLAQERMRTLLTADV